jgi:hypothetical protein
MQCSKNCHFTQIRGGLVPPILSGLSPVRPRPTRLVPLVAGETRGRHALVAMVVVPSDLYCHLSQQQCQRNGSSNPHIIDTVLIWQFVACWVLSSFTRTAATRSHKVRDPLALLPVARSPSQAHYCTRWWAFTPPFHPLPAPSSLLPTMLRRRESSLLRL